MTRQRPKQSRMGRPPRTDGAVRVGFMLSAELRRWLRSRSRVEKRPQGDVLASALALYRRHVARGGKS